MPIAVFFARRGHAVYRVSSAKAADLRRFLRRHAKSNGIDAETLARMPLADPGGLQQLELPGADAAALDRRVRACDRLTEAASEHKVRIKDLVRQLMPMTPLTGDLGKADLAVLERYADPRALLAAGDGRAHPPDHHARPASSRARSGPAQWRAAAAAALDLYGDHPAVPFEELAAEVATEVRLLRADPGRAGRARRRPRAALPAGRSRPARPVPARVRRDQRPGPGRGHGPPRPVPRRDPVQVLRRARPAGQRDRGDRPQGPADEQGRAVPAARHVRSAPPTPPAARTRSSPGSTTCR